MKITGITKQGFHYSVDDAVGDDWELIEILSEMNNDEYLSVVPFAKKYFSSPLDAFCVPVDFLSPTVIKLSAVSFSPTCPVR